MLRFGLLKLSTENQMVTGHNNTTCEATHYLQRVRNLEWAASSPLNGIYQSLQLDQTRPTRRDALPTSKKGSLPEAGNRPVRSEKQWRCTMSAKHGFSVTLTSSYLTKVIRPVNASLRPQQVATSLSFIDSDAD